MAKYILSQSACFIFACFTTAQIFNARAGDKNAIDLLQSPGFGYAVVTFFLLAVATLAGLFIRAVRH